MLDSTVDAADACYHDDRPVFVNLSTDVNSDVIINLIIEGANCFGCIWCDLFEMCCYDKRVIVYLFVKRKAEVLHC